MMRRSHLLAAAGAIGTAVLAGLAVQTRAHAGPEEAPLLPVPDEASARGRLTVSVHAPVAAGTPVSHTTTLVNGQSWSGMEDNDLRGYLDGRFQSGWNQPGQIHVRVGRKERGARWGETELFRVLQRWSDLPLPPGSSVRRARLSIGVEAEARQPIRLLLYEVLRDWDPGTGGTLNNNNSPPKPGEVWWNDRGYGSAAWGLPGVGYAAAAPDADTDVMPLAETLYAPGDARIEFESSRLTGYLERRAAAREPLLLLLKVSDLQEDVPGSRIYLYSANHGDDRNIARRPSLAVEWRAPAAYVAGHDVALEYGRTWALPPFRIAPGAWLAATFLPDSGSGALTVQVRGGTAADTTPWRNLAVPIRTDWEWAQLRVVAAADPVPLGEPFHAELRDTWVLTAAPEEQRVLWRFVSPTGRVHEKEAVYQGEYRWSITFEADEIGPWRYGWTQDFLEGRYHSGEGRFDVVPGSREALLARLDALGSEAHAGGQGRDDPDAIRASVVFTRLLRGLLIHETPRSFRAASGDSLRAAVDRARTALSGEPVPDSSPLVPHEPHAWQRAAAEER